MSRVRKAAISHMALLLSLYPSTPTPLRCEGHGARRAHRSSCGASDEGRTFATPHCEAPFRAGCCLKPDSHLPWIADRPCPASFIGSTGSLAEVHELIGEASAVRPCSTPIRHFFARERLLLPLLSPSDAASVVGSCADDAPWLSLAPAFVSSLASFTISRQL